MKSNYYWTLVILAIAVSWAIFAKCSVPVKVIYWIIAGMVAIPFLAAHLGKEWKPSFSRSQCYIGAIMSGACLIIGPMALVAIFATRAEWKMTYGENQ